MSRYVLDCSVTMAWCFEDEANAFTESLYEQLPQDQILVPDIWSVETINILAVAERCGRITVAKSDQFLDMLRQVSITIDHGCSRGFLADVLAFARTHKLSAYDAAYLELAGRESIALATQDVPLRKAAKAAGVSIL